MSKHSQASAGLPRWFEFGCACLALLLLAPLMLALALAIKVSSTGPILFRQKRVGRRGNLFELLKFRTMRSEPNISAQVTAAGDHRITGVGRWLRATKLDELPELLNIVRGEMSVVGPRPEVPRFVKLSDEGWQEILSVRPGLTDAVTLLLRDEEAVLAVGAERTGLSAERFYEEHLLPFKLELGQIELRRRSAWSDVKIAFRTAAAIVRPRQSPSDVVDRVLASEEQSTA